MKMEHINENTIRVLLGSDDLSARGITVLDLLGNRVQIQEFFYSILDEVDADHKFRESNDAVTFQVLPTRTGLELFISKPDPNDVDGSSNSNNEAISKYIKQEMTEQDEQPMSTDDLFNFGKSMDELSAGQDQEQESINSQPQVTRVVKFKTFEDLLAACEQVTAPDSMASDLYKMNSYYYLVLTFFNDGMLSTETIDDLMAIFSEYTISTSATEDVLGEHGHLLMNHSALERIRYYFD